MALAIRYGQPPLAAYLLPVSIDGLVAVSSLVMVRAARTRVSASWLARTGLVLAVIATLTCNVGYEMHLGLKPCRRAAGLGAPDRQVLVPVGCRQQQGSAYQLIRTSER
jgi:hypothetical protein